MNNHDTLGLLGLAKRAGRLVIGDEPVHELISANKARCVFVARDAGAGIVKKLTRRTEEENIPFLVIPATKEELGGALGRLSCAVCATDDSGFAASAAQKIASGNSLAGEAAQKLAVKHERILIRRAKPRKEGAGKKVSSYIDIEEDKYNRRFTKTGEPRKPEGQSTQAEQKQPQSKLSPKAQQRRESTKALQTKQKAQQARQGSQAPRAPYAGKSPRAPYAGHAPQAESAQGAPQPAQDTRAPRAPYAGKSPRAPYAGKSPRAPYAGKSPRAPYAGKSPRAPYAGHAPQPAPAESAQGSPQPAQDTGAPRAKYAGKSPRAPYVGKAPRAGQDTRAPQAKKAPKLSRSGKPLRTQPSRQGTKQEPRKRT